jgi:hypothetical protein
MPNYQKTEELYKKENVPYSKPPEQMAEERFFEQVKNPITGDYFQLETLKNAAAVPYDFTLPPGFENKKFPVITVNSIIRSRTSDGKEWLLSRQTYQGLDRVGNIVSKSIDDQEVYDKPIWQYSTQPIGQQSNQNNSVFVKTERRISGVSIVRVHDKPFTPENLDELFALVPGENEKAKEAAVSLVIAKYDQTGNRVDNPYGITGYNDFRNRPFEELYDYASTPRTSDQTKMGKEEQNKKTNPYG